MKVRKLTLLAVLLAATIVIAILESFIPSFFIPGVKLGLANIVILVALYELGIKDAILIDVIRVLVVSLVRGNFSFGLYSFPFSLLLNGDKLPKNSSIRKKRLMF